MKLLLASLAVVLMVSASAQAGLLADFDAAGTQDAIDAVNDGTIEWGDIAPPNTQWETGDKYATDDWTISGGTLNYYVPGANQTTQAIAAFKVNLANPTDHKVWAIQFDVIAGGRDASSSGLNDFDVYLGTDDTNNIATDPVASRYHKGYAKMKTGVVVNDEWNWVFNDGWIYQEAGDNSTITTPFHQDYSGGGQQNTVKEGGQQYLKDPSGYDTLVFQIQSNSKAGNETVIDNLAVVEVDPAGDYDADGTWDTDDIDAMTALGDLVAGVIDQDAKYDLASTTYDGSDDSHDIYTSDMNSWLYWAARGNSTYGAGGTAYYTAYKASDTDLDRDVDITDFNRIPTNFSPVANPANVFSMGDSNGDSKIDITDFNQLVIDFAPAGYGEEVPPGVVALGAAAGTIDLIVDVVTGDVSLDVASGGVSINSFQVVSVDLGLTVDGMNPPPNVLAVSFGSTTQFYAEGSMSDTLLAGGMYSLGDIYDVLKGKTDLTFEYASTTLGTVPGDVIYVPEPATMALLGLGGLVVMIRRRRLA